MAGVFEPPPTWAPPVELEDDRWVFNPVWLRWFGDLIVNFDADGLPISTPVDSQGILASQIFGP